MSGMPSIGTCTSRAAGSRCWSTSSPIRTTKPDSARCCAGSIAKRGRPTRTRSAPSRCTPASGACCADPATSRSNRRWSSWSRSMASTCRRVLREHRPVARHARRLGSGSMSGLARHEPARRYRHRRRQPVGRATRAQHQTFENIYALPRAACVVRAARRSPDLRDHAPGGKRPAIARTCCARCCSAATARSARITTRGKRRRARAEDIQRHPVRARSAADRSSSSSSPR